MKLLLDTHGFLWSLFSPEKLSQRARSEITSPENEASVSVATFWEISLKYGLGKLELSGVAPEQLPDFASQMDLAILPISPAEASSFYQLPRYSHKDPFDRIIIWQAIQRRLALISKDRDFNYYRALGLKVIW
ncbi:MAG: type II toxin-antitoxin system VapC family toxin [Desulfobacteraceae bacterium]